MARLSCNNDPQPAFDLIQKLNPDMPSDKTGLCPSVKMIEYNIVTGDNKKDWLDELMIVGKNSMKCQSRIRHL